MEQNDETEVRDYAFRLKTPDETEEEFDILKEICCEKCGDPCLRAGRACFECEERQRAYVRTLLEAIQREQERTARAIHEYGTGYVDPPLP